MIFIFQGAHAHSAKGAGLDLLGFGGLPSGMCFCRAFHLRAVGFCKIVIRVLDGFYEGLELISWAVLASRFRVR